MTRFYRIEHQGASRYAVEESAGSQWHLVDGDVFGAWKKGSPVAADGAKLLAPVTPSKIVAIGRNYRDHAAELNNPVPAEPLMFLKPPSAIVASGEAIVLPSGAGRVDHEAELGVIVGSRARHVRREDAWRHVFGFTCVNDVTARELQKKDVQFTRGKGFDTFAPIGPCIVAHSGGAPAPFQVEGWVNGACRQSGSTADLIFPVDELIAFISAVMTLLPGDIICTGTPAGVGPLHAGDQVTVKIAGVGELTNPVQ
jgi:2-keto-4-pentenoate hydratase/2-oxohepta-3-ene-1,7-dioic acid hydratase in catechol pathway